MPVKIKRSRSDSVNLTPMIDVVFQLMIFFLVATRLDDSQHYLPVVLPQASEARPLISKPEEMVVNVDRTGAYFVGGTRLDDAGLERALQQAAANNPGRQQVVIRSDQHAEMRFVVKVMDLCKKTRVNSYSVATQPAG